MSPLLPVAPLEAFDWVGVSRLLRQDGQRPAVLPRWCQEHEGEERRILVARTATEVSGFIRLARAAGGRMRLSDLYVGVAFRGCGWGGALLAAAEATAWQAGVHAVGVVVESAREAALHAFLAHRGYRVDAGVPAAPGETGSALWGKNLRVIELPSWRCAA